MLSTDLGSGDPAVEQNRHFTQMDTRHCDTTKMSQIYILLEGDEYYGEKDSKGERGTGNAVMYNIKWDGQCGSKVPGIWYSCFQGFSICTGNACQVI